MAWRLAGAFVGVSLFLFACNKVNGDGYGGGDQFAQSLTAAQNRMVAAAKLVTNQGYSQSVCTQALCVIMSTTLCASFNQLGDKMSAVNQFFGSSDTWNSYLTAAGNANVQETTQTLTWNDGTVVDALTEMGVGPVKVNESRNQGKSSDELAALLGHEVGHLLNNPQGTSTCSPSTPANCIEDETTYQITTSDGKTTGMTGFDLLNALGMCLINRAVTLGGPSFDSTGSQPTLSGLPGDLPTPPNGLPTPPG